MNETMNKKTKNIILISALSVAIAALIGVFIYTASQENKEQKAIPWNGENIVAEDILNRSAAGMESLQKYLLDGKCFTATTAKDSKLRIFEFMSSGSYYGYTTEEDNDLGSWSLSNEKDGIYVVIDTMNATNRYKIDHNNNNDITLTADDNTVFVLKEKVKEENLGFDNDSEGQTE